MSVGQTMITIDDDIVNDIRCVASTFIIGMAPI